MQQARGGAPPAAASRGRQVPTGALAPGLPSAPSGAVREAATRAVPTLRPPAARSPRPSLLYLRPRPLNAPGEPATPTLLTAAGAPLEPRAPSLPPPLGGRVRSHSRPPHAQTPSRVPCSSLTRSWLRWAALAAHLPPTLPLRLQSPHRPPAPCRDWRVSLPTVSLSPWIPHLLSTPSLCVPVLSRSVPLALTCSRTAPGASVSSPALCRPVCPCHSPV